MMHPVLGQLTLDEKNSMRGEIALGSRGISLHVDPDDRTVDEALALATVIASSLQNYDRISKDIIAADLLESYNSGWNEYEQAQDDGTFKTVRNPQLSPSEFKDRFVLTAIYVCSDSCVDLWYEDGGLFWGHSVLVQSLDGGDFANAQAQLFG